MKEKETGSKKEARSKNHGLNGLTNRQITKGGVDITAKRKNANKKTGARQNMSKTGRVPNTTPSKRITTKQLAELFGCQPSKSGEGCA